MKRVVILGGVISAGFVAWFVGTTINNMVTMASSNSTIATGVSCAWSADDQDTSVVVVMNGADDCDTAFGVISDTGLNWSQVGTGGGYTDNLKCSLSSGSETMNIYEVDQDAYPLVFPGNELCSEGEQSGWVPS